MITRRGALCRTGPAWKRKREKVFFECGQTQDRKQQSSIKDKQRPRREFGWLGGQRYRRNDETNWVTCILLLQCSSSDSRVSLLQCGQCFTSEEWTCLLITFAGQYVESNGDIVGTQTVEKVKNNEILVGAGEAVLVSVSH